MDLYDLYTMRVLMTGGGGFIGRALAESLRAAGHTLVYLRRQPGDAGSIIWDPILEILDPAKVEGFDAVIHLAGEPILGWRWTAHKKKAIRTSRVQGTHFLAKILSQLKKPPASFLCASAIGFYGDRGEESLIEEHPPGEGFLPQVCVDWEAATEPAQKKQIRVAHLRFGIVLDPNGGALQWMLPVFRVGLGGPIGNGQQYMSWVSLTDTVRAIGFVLESRAIEGPINITAPEPIRNEEFIDTLAHSLHRPAIFRVPAFMATLALGEMAPALLLASTRAIPKTLLDNGFKFRHPDLRTALTGLLI